MSIDSINFFDKCFEEDFGIILILWSIYGWYKMFVLSGMRLQIGHIGESHIFLANIFEDVAMNPQTNFVSHILQLRVSFFICTFICIPINIREGIHRVIFVMMEKYLHFIMIYIFHDVLVNFWSDNSAIDFAVPIWIFVFYTFLSFHLCNSSIFRTMLGDEEICYLDNLSHVRE